MHRHDLRNRLQSPARVGAPLLGIALVAMLAGCATTSSYNTGSTITAASVAPGIVPRDRNERVALTLSEWTPPPAMSCVLQERPWELPEPAQLLNVEELQGELDQMWNALDRPRGSILMSVGYSATGRPHQFHVVETSLEDTTLARDIASMVDQRLYRLEPGEEFGVRLRLTLSEQTSLDVGRREMCFPRWAESPSLGSLAEDPGVEEAQAMIARDESALRVFMNDEGDIVDAYALAGATGSGTVAQLIESSRDAGLSGIAMLDREPAGFWFTARTGERNYRQITEGGVYRQNDPYYRDSYCEEFWRPGSLCDPFYRSSYRSYGGYYGYSPYGYYAYGTGGWWGMVPWWYVPYNPPAGGNDGRPPADTIIPPGKVIPAPSVPPSRPSRPVVGVGRPNYPTDGAERRVIEEREEIERARREAAAQRPGEREARGAPLRAAPEAGDVGTGSTGATVRPTDGSRSITRPQPDERAPVRTERARPELLRPDAGRPEVTRPAVRESARPSPESRSVPPVTAPRVERSRPAPSSTRPSSGGTARPAPSSARPSSGGARPAPPSARPSGGARPAPVRQSRPSPRPSAERSRPEPAKVRPSTPPPDQQ